MRAARPAVLPVVLLAVATASAVISACRDSTESRPLTVSAGDPAKGKSHMTRYGCGSCHVIPGVRGADSLVGPPLSAFGRRSLVAGTLPNSGENLARWIQDPPAFRPGTGMPDLGVSEREATDMAAYLHTLR